jgi:hypothetical protein
LFENYSENEDEQQQLKQRMTDDPEAASKLPCIAAPQLPRSHCNKKIAVFKDETNSSSNVDRETNRTNELP